MATNVDTDTLICEYPTCHSVGQLCVTRMRPSGDTVEYVRCNVHTLLDVVVPVVHGRTRKAAHHG